MAWIIHIKITTGNTRVDVFCNRGKRLAERSHETIFFLYEVEGSPPSRSRAKARHFTKQANQMIELVVIGR
jgi:hypothetical protein